MINLNSKLFRKITIIIIINFLTKILLQKVSKNNIYLIENYI